MKLKRSIFIAISLFMLFPLLALAQESATEAVDWLVSYKDTIVTIVLGIISTQIIKIPKAWIPEEMKEALRKTITVSVSLIIPAAVTWLASVLYPLAQTVDDIGLWAVVVAVAGMSFVWYRVEGVLDGLKVWFYTVAIAAQYKK